MIFTIGHSTRPFEAFVALLRAHGVARLADVRTAPGSRRHPQFAREALERGLGSAGIAYRHFPGLGGLRKPGPNSANAAWHNESFRAYADYMQTAEFSAALDGLIGWAGDAARQEEVAVHAAIMCAEAVWWRCHRRLVADALLARGVPVRHIIGARPAEPHVLTAFARVGPDRKVSYPGLL